MKNDPVGSNRGGGGRILGSTVHETQLGHPLNLRDLAVCQRAAAKVRSRIVSESVSLRNAGMSTASLAVQSRLLRILRSLCADMSRNANTTMTERQREICARVLGLEKLPEPLANPVLFVLPKRPPTRIARPEEDDDGR